VKYIKYAVSIFIERNQDFLIEGCPITDIAIDSNFPTLDSYKKDIVEAMNRSAGTLILIIVPIVLRCNITILDFDFDKGVNSITNSALRPHIDFKMDDGLDFHDKTIYVLLKVAHYDLLVNHNIRYDEILHELEKEVVSYL